MADDSASVVSLDRKRAAKAGRAKTGAERSRAYRERQRQEANRPPIDSQAEPEGIVPVTVQPIVTPVTPVTAVAAAVTPVTRNVPSRHGAASVTVQGAALALAFVGIAMNGWFAQSLGSSDAAGWLFLAVGTAADVVALVMPSCAASLWHGRRRGAALAGWLVWLVTLLFAVTAGIGFASTNISDVTLARASRVTPAVQSARDALGDAMAARDRECKGGVGKYCRDREAAVAERRQSLDAAMAAIGGTADPQADAAIRLTAWLSGGALHPAPADFSMLRLALLALLPQLGGVLLMLGAIGRRGA